MKIKLLQMSCGDYSSDEYSDQNRDTFRESYYEYKGSYTIISLAYRYASYMNTSVLEDIKDEI